MPIIDLQRRIAEIGRIRIGQQVPSANGKTRPEKLETFRLTSADKTRIALAAELFGGTIQQWQAPAGQQWEIITTATALDVIVPPSDIAFSQWYELWSAGGCQRRCDGQNESISEGACLCDPENRECDIHTRLSVLLKDLPGLGVWRVDTQGYYAAVELQGAVEVIQIAAGRGQMLPARLRLEQRMVKRPGEQTRRFAVPVLDIEMTPGQLLTPAPERAAIGAPSGVDGVARLTPVPADLPSRPAGKIGDQMRKGNEPRETPARRNAAQPLSPTGIQPRTITEVAAGNPDIPPGPAVTDEDGEDPRSLPGSITGPQMKHLHAALTGLGFDNSSGTDRQQMLTICEILAGRELTGPHQGRDGNPSTTKNLSLFEAMHIIDKIKEHGTRDALTAYTATCPEPASA
jgi:hypothetical protein